MKIMFWDLIACTMHLDESISDAQKGELRPNTSMTFHMQGQNQ